MKKPLLPGLPRFMQFLKNYAYYRKQGWPHRRAWQLAAQTLPP